MFTLVADCGSFQEIAGWVNFNWGRFGASASGSFSETGQAASLNFGFTLVAGKGAFSETGQSSTLTLAYYLSAVKSSLSVSGPDASLLLGVATLQAQQVMFSWVGEPVVFNRTLPFPPLPSSSFSLVSPGLGGGLIMALTDSVPVNSGGIVGANYDAAFNTLTVIYNLSKYMYRNVSPQQWDNFRKAKDKAKYLKRNITPFYPVSKI